SLHDGDGDVARDRRMRASGDGRPVSRARTPDREQGVMKRRGLPLVAALALAAVGLASPPALAADAGEAQLEHTSAIVSLTGGRAGAVTFESGEAVLERFGAWIESESAAGTVTASVRTDVTDPATE